MLLIAVAAAASFGLPIADAELASVVSFGRASLRRFADAQLSTTRPLPIQEQVDDWWVEDGAALIAAAVSPKPALPSFLDLRSLTTGGFAIHVERVVSASSPR